MICKLLKNESNKKKVREEKKMKKQEKRDKKKTWQISKVDMRTNNLIYKRVQFYYKLYLLVNHKHLF